jgi:signal transduction histidine kinase
VLRNLLSNAIKFSPSHSSIHLSAAPASISWRRAKDHSRAGVVIKFCDQGVGVPETELESIFDKFVQSSKTRTGAGGTGLGLAICREIVEAHHGRIYAENCPDGGTCLVCMLPLKQHYVEAESSV